ncbi:MAG: ABC transporter permease [Elusimicrobia bacterium RIFOXYA2_FULL_39_19]|nr:MAG: ABC transporter permease [Elusimicrobia bacterium RIFOXYA2_FULL_39_19]
MNRIIHIVKKEYIQTFKDKRMIMLIFVAPVIQLILLGYAVNMDIKHISTAIIDRDKTFESRDLIKDLSSSGYFDITGYYENEQNVHSVFQKEKAEVVISIPPGFARKLKRMEKAPLQFLVDGSDSNFATIASNTIAQAVRKYADKYSRKMLERAKYSVKIPKINVEVRVWYNPEIKSSNYMVPGVICMILLVVTTMLTSMAITREREIGTMEQLMVTPIKPIELMLGKLIPFAIVGLCDVGLIVAAAVAIFGVPFNGNIFLLFFLSGLFLLTTLGMGLFISTISHTQQQAMMSTFMFIMPSIILSGFFFPVANMPKLAQYVTYLIPLRYFLNILRSIFLKGSGLDVLWPDALALLVFGVGIILLSAMRFKKKLG